MKNWIFTCACLAGLATGQIQAGPLPFSFQLDASWTRSKDAPSSTLALYKKGKSQIRFKAVSTQQKVFDQREVDEINRQIESKTSAQLLDIDNIPGIYTRVAKKRFFKTRYKLNCRFIKNQVEYFIFLDYRGGSLKFDATEKQFIDMIKSIRWM